MMENTSSNNEQLFSIKLETTENSSKLEDNNKTNSSPSSSFVCQQCNSELNNFVEFISNK